MINRLAPAVYADGIGKVTQVKFGGYDRRVGVGDGTLWYTENLSARDYPVLSPRQARRLWRRLERPNGLYAHDGLFWVDGTSFYANGNLVGIVSDSKKRFASLGAYVIILPDRMAYNRLTGEFTPLGIAWVGAVSFLDGTYAGEEAEGCAIVTTGAPFPFNAGDAVTIAGCKNNPDNNKTVIIREVSTDCRTLTFYENSFTVGAETAVTISREVPELRFICENENRLWGCDGNTVYASKLGDPFNWNVFDGISTDSFAVSVGSAGEFTGCISYMGYPCFFKENHIYKVYGAKPSDFQLMSSASLGVDAGSGDSLAVAGETLFYLSRVGVTAYAGGVPQNAAEVFGGERYADAVAGSDGRRYYISMRDGEGKYSLFCYDTEAGMWHREDESRAVAFAYHRGLWMLCDDGRLWLMPGAEEFPIDSVAETMIISRAEFGDFTEGSPNKKGTAKLQLRAELDAGAYLSVKIMYDSDGTWHEVALLKAEKKRSFYLPVIPQRSDHFRIALDGAGSWRLYSLTREHYAGSEM